MAGKAPSSGAKIYAIMNNKGGPGKTSTATNLAVTLARAGNRVLLVDSDQQANSTEVLANGKKYYSMYGATICDLYNNARFDVRDAIVPAVAGEISIPNLDLIPSDPTFEKIIEQTLTRSHREKIMARHLEKVRSDYDYIIFDCAPGLNIAAGNAIYIADHVLVPVDGGSFSLSGLEIMLDYMDEISEEDYSRSACSVIITTEPTKKLMPSLIRRSLSMSVYRRVYSKQKSELTRLLYNPRFSVFRFITTRKVQWH